MCEMIQPLISVLMGTYRTSISFLEEAVNSILHQTYHNIEFVIVNDGSDDEKEIAYLEHISLADRRVKVITNEQNMGLTKSLNVGLKQCHGKYIARMDADDIAMSDRLERQLQYMEAHPEVALVGSEIIVFGEDIEECDRSKRYDRMMDPEIYRIRSLIQNAGPPHPTFFLRSDFLKKNQIAYREDILKAQDYGLIADVLKADGRIYKIKEPLLRYRMHAGQISTTSEIMQIVYQSKVSYDYIRFLFPELRKEEISAITVLGNRVPLELMISTIEHDSQLEDVCRDFKESRDDLQEPQIYIGAIQKLLRLNKQRRFFKQTVLRREICAEYWERDLREIVQERKHWCVRPFVIMAYFDSRRVRREKKKLW